MAIYKKSDISPISQKNNSPSKSSGGAGEKSDDDDSADGAGEKSDDDDSADGAGDSNDENDGEDQLDQSIEDKLSQRKDKTVDDMKKEAGKSKKSGRGNPNAVSNLKPTVTAKIKAVNWRDLIKRFVSSSGPPELTYTKPGRGIATQIHQAQQLGSMALKQGERPGEAVFKLIIVFDTSGSMYGTIESALAATADMLQKNKGSLTPIIGLTYFADSPLYYAADLINNTAWEIPSFKDLKKGSPPNKIPLSQALSSTMGGGTIFDSTLSKHLATMAREGYNIIIFSDWGIMDRDNYTNFISLYGVAGKKLFFIADNNQTFQELIAKMKTYPDTFGHMS